MPTWVDDKHAALFFVSHGSPDKESLARPLTRGLRERGVLAWLDEEDLDLGGLLHKDIAAAIAASAGAVVICTPGSIQRPWVEDETELLLRRFKGERRMIVPWLRGVDVEALMALHAWLPAHTGTANEDPVQVADRIADGFIAHLSRARAEGLVVTLADRSRKEAMGAAPDLRCYSSRERTPQERTSALRRVLEPLTEVLAAKASESPRVRLVPRCSNGFALLAGSLLHEAWGGQVTCLQALNRADGTREDLWMEVDGRVGDDPLTLSSEHGDGEELHVLVSVSQSVERGWRAWCAQHAGPREALMFRPVQGVGREVISSDEQLRAAARQISRAVLAARPGASRVRFFSAAPGALMVAVGRRLNGVHPWVAMDWSNNGVYVEDVVSA